MKPSLTTVLLMLAGSPVVAAAQAPTAISPVPATDHPETTSSGATFTSPAAWLVKKTARVTDLIAPEGDLDITLVDVGSAPDGAAAAVAAWQLWSPQKARPQKLITVRPARNGWDERQVVDYETSPNEKRVMQAIAYRAGTSWTVVILDGSEGTAEKRGAAASLTLQSLRPAGYKRESFAGRTAHPMDAARIEELKAFVAQSMKELGVPGAAFALTTRSKTIYSTGVGVRQLGKATPVDADSEFAIASNTKGLATLMLAKLVDEGKLR